MKKTFFIKIDEYFVLKIFKLKPYLLFYVIHYFIIVKTFF